jgi:hypothetical protein
MSENNSPQTMEEALDPNTARQRKWSDFIETSVVDFFSNYKLEKMTLEDGNGNKAKLSMTKDGGIKVEYATMKIL